MLGDLNQQNAAGNPPGGYGGGGYGPPPGGGGYGPPPGGQPPGGAPPGGYGPPPGAPPGAGVPAQPTQPAVPSAGAPGGAAKKSPIGLIIGLVVGLFALGGIGYAAWWYFGSSGPVLAKYAPKDTQIYVEVPSMSKALLQLAGTDIIDTKELEPDAKVDDMIDGLSSAFDISKDDAKDIIKGVSGVAFMGRDMSKKGSAAVIVSFSTNIEKLLKSKRFNKGDAMHGATTYEIDRRDVDFDKLAKMSPYEKSFSMMSMKGDHDTFAWIESKKLAVFGDKDMVEDTTRVIAGDKDALTTNDTFKQAKYEGGSVMIAYVDPEVIDDKDVKKDYFDGIAPFTGSLRFTSAGMVTTLSGQLKGKKLPDDKTLESAAKLDMAEKLPADTVGYIAFSTKSKLTGKEAQEQVIKSMKDANKEQGKAFEKELDQVEKDYGISLATAYDAIGDQAIFAITASDKLKLDKNDPPKPEDILDNVGGVFAMAVKDKKAAEKLVKTLREEVVEKLGKDVFDTTAKDGGFTAKPKEDKFPMVKVVFQGDYLIFAVGKKERVNAIVDGFSGNGQTLKDDKAHKKALNALNTKPHLLLWLDTGRFVKTLLDDKDLKDTLKEQKIPYKALKVDGDDRMTTALAVELKANDGTWSYKVEGLNIAGAGALGGFAAMGLMRPKHGGFDSPPDDGGGGGGGSGGSVGVPECDQYLTKMEACISKMPPSAQDSMRQSLKQSREAWAKAAAIGPAAMDGLKTGCQSALDSLSKMPMCN